MTISKNRKERIYNGKLFEERLMIAYLLGYDKFTIYAKREGSSRDVIPNSVLDRLAPTPIEYVVECSATTSNKTPVNGLPHWRISNFDSLVAANMSVAYLAIKIHDYMNKEIDLNASTAYYGNLKEDLNNTKVADLHDEKTISKFLSKLISNTQVTEEHYNETLEINKDKIMKMISAENKRKLEEKLNNVNKKAAQSKGMEISK